MSSSQNPISRHVIPQVKLPQTQLNPIPQNQKPVQKLTNLPKTIEDCYDQLNTLVYDQLSKEQKETIVQGFKILYKAKQISLLSNQDRQHLEEIHHQGTLPLQFLELLVNVQKIPDFGSSIEFNYNITLTKFKKLHDLEVYLNSNQLESLSQLLFELDIPQTPKKKRFSWIRRTFQNKERKKLSRVIGSIANQDHLENPMIEEIVKHEFSNLDVIEKDTIQFQSQILANQN